MAPEDETEPLSAEDQQGFDFDRREKAAVVEYPNAGHRERVRARIMNGGAAGMLDYELVEYLLFAAYPRRDTKALAKSLIDRFGSFERLVSASMDELSTVLKKNENAIAMLKMIEAAAIRLAGTKLKGRDAISSHAALLDYCRISISNQPTEQFRVLFLDTKNMLIRDAVMGQGTIDHAPVYVREILAKALQLGAKSMILVHNHPSGDPTPSSADIAMTKEIASAARPLGIAVHDHLVIGRNGHTSFRAKGLL